MLTLGTNTGAQYYVNNTAPLSCSLYASVKQMTGTDTVMMK